jgi:hypothetical protein
MSPRWARRGLVGALLALGVVSSAWAQTTEIDPSTLIGRWTGSWVGAHQARRNGQYYLTIERVEGGKVYGRREIVGRHDTDGQITGRLSGNRLTFSKIELTIDGDAMRGAGPDYTITLTKEK